MLATIIFYSSSDLNSPEQDENFEVNNKKMLRVAQKDKARAAYFYVTLSILPSWQVKGPQMIPSRKGKNNFFLY